MLGNDDRIIIDTRIVVCNKELVGMPKKCVTCYLRDSCNRIYKTNSKAIAEKLKNKHIVENNTVIVSNCRCSSNNIPTDNADESIICNDIFFSGGNNYENDYFWKRFSNNHAY